MQRSPETRINEHALRLADIMTYLGEKAYASAGEAASKVMASVRGNVMHHNRRSGNIIVI